MGRAMGLDDEVLHDLHFASLLHDVGMLRIPLEHQRDPKYFRKHSTFGHKVLSRIRVWERAAPMVLQHHERLDGAGYPDGIAADDICLGARILAVCDTWDALRTKDWNRDALSVEDALTEIEANSGGQFDPEIVATFKRLVEQGQL
jgi:HD-GYP domain-containing protein (c-di-GMP phosphodiesterase class II)